MLFPALLVLSCKGSQGDTGPAGPNLTGSLHGFVGLWDTTENQLGSSPSVVVELLGANRISHCDSTGKWIFDSLRTGIYDISFRMTGFGTFVKRNFQFLGGGDIYAGYFNLGQLPAFSVTFLVATSSQTAIEISGRLSSPPPSGLNRFVMVFVGADSTVSSDPKKYLASYAATTGSDSFEVAILASFLHGKGLASGSLAYVCAYGWNIIPTFVDQEGGQYIDPQTGRYVYVTLGEQASPTAAVAIP